MSPAETIRQPNPGASRPIRITLGLAVLGIALWYTLVTCTRPSGIGDEGLHLTVIRALANGDWQPVHNLPMPPTYHLLMALPARLFGANIAIVRAANALLALLAIFLYHLAARHHHPDYSPHHLLRFACNPLLLPLWVLIYTDLASLLALLLALNLHLRRHTLLTVAALLLACLIRQSNLVWVAFFATLTIDDWWRRRNHDQPTPFHHKLHHLLVAAARQTWPHLLLLLAAAITLTLRGGPVLSTTHENTVRPNIAQFYLFALTAGLLWIPLWTRQLPALWTRRIAPTLLRGWGSAAAIAAVGLLALAFSNPHPWNQDLTYLRNWPLRAMADLPPARWLLSALIVVVAAALLHATWQSRARRTLALIWLCSFLFLLPHYLVDPRYFVIPVVLIDFFTPLERPLAQKLTGWYLLLTLAVATLIACKPGSLSGLW